MLISNSIIQQNTSFSISSAVEKSTLGNSTEQFDITAASPLEYYNELCKEYPDITFRLSDKEEALKHEWYTGYGGSMNQRGDNFGMPGQCSIDIDVAAIRNMLSDKNYEMKIKGEIEYARKKYSDYEREGLDDGCSYTCVCIEDDGGKPVLARCHSHMPFSTEEELKKLWSNNDYQKKMQFKFDSMKNDLLDTYLSFVDRNLHTKIKYSDISKKGTVKNPDTIDSLFSDANTEI